MSKLASVGLSACRTPLCLQSRSRSLSRRPDVLIEPEQVAWIVFGLQRRKARVIRAVRAGHAIVLVLRHEVHIDPAGREGGGFGKQTARPIDGPRLVPRVAPPCM